MFNRWQPHDPEKRHKECRNWRVFMWSRISVHKKNPGFNNHLFLSFWLCSDFYEPTTSQVTRRFSGPHLFWTDLNITWVWSSPHSVKSRRVFQQFCLFVRWRLLPLSLFFSLLDCCLSPFSYFFFFLILYVLFSLSFTFVIHSFFLI